VGIKSFFPLIKIQELTDALELNVGSPDRWRSKRHLLIGTTNKTINRKIPTRVFFYLESRLLKRTQANYDTRTLNDYSTKSKSI